MCPQWCAYDLFLSYVSDYVTQTTLQTRRKYSLLDTRGLVSEMFFFLLFVKVEDRGQHTWSSNSKTFIVLKIRCHELKGYVCGFQLVSEVFTGGIRPNYNL